MLKRALKFSLNFSLKFRLKVGKISPLTSLVITDVLTVVIQFVKYYEQMAFQMNKVLSYSFNFILFFIITSFFSVPKRGATDRLFISYPLVLIKILELSDVLPKPFNF